MEYRSERHIGEILKERNIVLKGADAATRGGFTQDYGDSAFNWLGRKTRCTD